LTFQTWPGHTQLEFELLQDTLTALEALTVFEDIWIVLDVKVSQ
jgi:hypothetical protein